MLQPNEEPQPIPGQTQGPPEVCPPTLVASAGLNLGTVSPAVSARHGSFAVAALVAAGHVGRRFAPLLGLEDRGPGNRMPRLFDHCMQPARGHLFSYVRGFVPLAFHNCMHLLIHDLCACRCSSLTGRISHADACMNTFVLCHRSYRTVRISLADIAIRAATTDSTRLTGFGCIFEGYCNCCC